MPKKKHTPSKIITPFRLSVGLNIVLSLIIISAISASAWAYHQYKGGTQAAARFSLEHMYDYCDMYYRNIDQWLKEAEEKGQSSGNPDEMKAAALNVDVLCVHEEFEPYQKSAMEAYYNAHGVKLFPDEGAL